ncbi:MAG: 3-deoxy-manno-octulosonate cytidylyltransferase [Hyphomicrobiales bacterium]|jgi:3-deoxy-manno-octulosonate cytidylyltransferase (CMP-KDO synthetase)|nr:3-deoxy-manno-octulosonate cytidylyltransferase [Hyphomicrobiales bacterium]|tara:strand:- start:137 stop:862 length:726 start_codon:yes stop_codon:yes gene_type:complete
MKNLIIIPARLESTRLPNKPLADINGEPMIAHVYKRAKEANIAKVIVAAGNVEIKEVIENIGGEAILTNPDHASGSDRIYEALNMYDKESKFDIIVNLQGDLPNIHKDALSKIISLLESNDADISTLGVKISSEEEFLNKNIVKAYVKNISESNYVDDFDRRFDIGKEEFLYHHVGIYGYKRKALETFIGFDQSESEIERKLEQMRAIENGMKIVLGLIDELPISVDTQEDLEIARRSMDL